MYIQPFKITSLLVIAFSLLSFGNQYKAQTYKQTVKGKVVDSESGAPLIGAYVAMIGFETTLSGITDVEGNFRIDNVPVGRASFKIGFLGYEEFLASEISIGSAKEVYLDIKLVESLTDLDEVVVTANKDNIKPNNNAAMISARSFSVEETKRFPASISDPGRMALSFAGVTTSDDETNEIVIRGNAPNFLLWRIEGMEVPNPNHFSEEGYSTGAVSILNTNMLDRSDFLTGAFPAEYGNALSGVFDIKLRNGNAQENEYAFQLGVMGTDLTVEGPFKEGYNGSYLINYRYSTLGILDKVIDFGEDFGAPVFQDLSFKVNLPVGKRSVFTLWGIGGTSESIAAQTKSDSLLFDDRFESQTYMSGASYSYFFENNSKLEAKLSFSGNSSDFIYEETDLIENQYSSDSDILRNNSKRVSVSYLKKFNSRTSMKTGVIGSLLDFNVETKYSEFGVDHQEVGGMGDGTVFQGFVQGKHRFNENLSTVFGVHASLFSLANNKVIEPRLGLEWSVHPKHSFSAGFGIHSRVLPINQYYVQTINDLGQTITPNKDLDLMQAAHYVLGYDWRVIKNGHVKVEAYYQDIHNVAIPVNPYFTESVVNGGYIDAELSSNGEAENYGVELTFEKFFSDQYYFLLTGSLYDSKYKASNGKWYDSYYNFNHTLNVVGGKEFTVGTEDNNTIGASFKLLTNGGKRTTPFDLEAYGETGQVMQLQDQRNEKQFKGYFRSDVSVYYQLNRAKVAHIISLDFQNVTNAKNVSTQYLDRNTGELKTLYQLQLIPLLNYKIEF